MRLIVGVLAVAMCVGAWGQSKFKGIPQEHRKYTLAEGVTERDVTYYSDGVACKARIFFPKGFDAEGKTAGIVAAQGWTGVANSIYKHGAYFAERGYVAMTIDYRGWGASGGFVELKDPDATKDADRFTEMTAKVTIRRTRLLPEKQVEDIRNAISYLQGEPGVDAEKIGIWGSSYAGGHVLTVASLDPRVKAVVAQVPGINAGAEGPGRFSGAALKDAIQRARTGQGGEYRTGFSEPRMVDLETQQKAAEYKPMNRVQYIPATVAVLLLTAGNDELINNERSAKAALELVKGPKKLIDYPGVGHFDIYIEETFPKAAGAAADWYDEHLK